ncbi:hypothetical protein AG1IA_09422 [Rhizoctonia solani AG-1 IA]|uniref:Uncharacterized protein n=1 Tax=Thanatephorus cucumeris (strain AG1-IA) TaxID=983506 RepID=L8WII4_THACA|nr:hypothetical protein AG1IA_09422 [Rhizoctonia solani AG-1 IA]
MANSDVGTLCPCAAITSGASGPAAYSAACPSAGASTGLSLDWTSKSPRLFFNTQRNEDIGMKGRQARMSTRGPTGRRFQLQKQVGLTLLLLPSARRDLGTLLCDETLRIGRLPASRFLRVNTLASSKLLSHGEFQVRALSVDRANKSTDLFILVMSIPSTIRFNTYELNSLHKNSSDRRSFVWSIFTAGPHVTRPLTPSHTDKGTPPADWFTELSKAYNSPIYHPEHVRCPWASSIPYRSRSINNSCHVLSLLSSNLTGQPSSLDCLFRYLPERNFAMALLVDLGDLTSLFSGIAKHRIRAFLLEYDNKQISVTSRRPRKALCLTPV